MKKLLILLLALAFISPLQAEAGFFDWVKNLFGNETIRLAGPGQTYQRSLIPYDSTENLGTTTNPWDELHVSEICLGGDCQDAWPTGGGGGSGGGTWSTTTSSVAGVLFNYTNNNDDVVTIGSNSSTTAEFFFDPNTLFAKIGGQLLVTGSTTLQNFTANNGTTTNATTTKIFSTTASSTNLFSLGATTTSLGITGITSSLLKTTATGGVTSALLGTDYLATITATAPLSGSGTAGSPLVLSTAGTWSGNAGTATALAANGTNCSAGSYPLGVDASGNSESCTVASTGTVTAVSVTSANGFAGSSSGGATPALTLSTSITGVLRGNGTAISAASNGTDYTLISATTCGGTDKVSAISASGAVTCSTDSGGSSSWATTSQDYYNSQFRDWSIVNGSLSPTTTLGVIVSASSSITRLSSLNSTSTNATSTNLTVSGTTRLSGLNCSANANGGTLTTDANGFVSCSDDDSSAGGGAYPFPIAGNATSSLTQFNAGLTAYSSSTITALTVTNGTTTNSTSTNSYISGTTRIASLNGILKGTTGVVSTASNGTDYTLISATTCGGSDKVSAISASGAVTCTTDVDTDTTASSTLLSDNNTWTGNNTFARATTTSLGITGISNSLLKTTATGGVVGATAGTDYSNFGASVGPTELQATDFGDWTCNGTICTLDATYLTANQTITLSGVIQGSGSTAIPTAYTGVDPRAWNVVNNTLTPTTTTWGILVNHASSTITNLSVFNGTTTNATSTNVSISGTLDIDQMTSALLLTGATGVVAEYAGTSCTNQFPRSLSALGVATCASVANTDLVSSTISGISLGSNLNDLTAGAGLSSSGTYNGGTARTFTFDGSSTFRDWRIVNSNLTPTTTIGIMVNASSSISSLSVTNGTTTNATTTNLTISGISGSTQCLQVDTNGKVSGAGSACGSGSGGGNSKLATSTDNMSIYPNGGIDIGLGIGTTTPHRLSDLNVASTAPALILSDTNGSTNAKHFGFFWNDGKLNFATTSDAQSATSTAGMSYAPGGSAQLGVGTSTPFTGVSIGTGNGSSTLSILVAEHRPATSTAMTIDWKMGNTQNVRLGSAAMTISFSNFTDGGTLKVLTCNPPTGTAGAVTWGTQVLWSGGTVPTQTTTAQKCDVWSFIATQATSTLKIFGTHSPNF